MKVMDQFYKLKRYFFSASFKKNKSSLIFPCSYEQKSVSFKNSFIRNLVDPLKTLETTKYYNTHFEIRNTCVFLVYNIIKILSVFRKANIT